MNCAIPSSRSDALDRFRKTMVAATLSDAAGSPLMIGVAYFEDTVTEGIFWPLEVLHSDAPLAENSCVMRVGGREARVIILAECLTPAGGHYHFRAVNGSCSGNGAEAIATQAR